MNAEFFFDTNILIYTFDSKSPIKQQRSRGLLRDALEKGNGAISWQVAQEFLNVARHKFENPLTPGEASDYLDQVLMPLWKVFPSPELFQDAIGIQRQSKYRFYDSLIVAGAIHSGAVTLYSEDLQNDRSFGRLRIVNPFRD